MRPPYESVRADLVRRYARLCRDNVSLERGAWRYSRVASRQEPRQGWKIHVSATVLTAADVLEACAPVLAGSTSVFKACRTLDDLLSLNSGIHYSQIGKFFTVYCASTDDFVELAAGLDRATKHLRGPDVPFDRQYRCGGVVFYRYGAFVHNEKPGAVHYINDPRGRRRVDRRAPGAAVPSWIDDPVHGHAPEEEEARLVLRKEYVVFKALSQRGKGGVYQALDLKAAPARLAVIKEGRRLGEMFWDGSDGRTRLEHEVRVLRTLRRDGIEVPAVLDTFGIGAHRYMALEHIRGRSFMRSRIRLLKRYAWSTVEGVHKEIAALLAHIHAAGWVWRDCKPDNIVVEAGRIRPLDFEGACRISDTDTLPWGAIGYSPPDILQKHGRAAGVREDDYGLGATSYHLGTGELPQGSVKRRERTLARTGCPRAFRRRILELLEC